MQVADGTRFRTNMNNAAGYLLDAPGSLRNDHHEARFSARLVPALHIERVVDASQRAVPIPQVQVLPDRAARRQVLRKRLPLTARPKHVEDGVQDLADRGRPPRLAGGISEPTSAHSPSVKSLSYRSPRRSAVARCSGFHMRHCRARAHRRSLRTNLAAPLPKGLGKPPLGVLANIRFEHAGRERERGVLR